MTKEEFLEMVREHLVLDVYVSKNWDNINIQVMLRDAETYEVLTSASDSFDLGFNK